MQQRTAILLGVGATLLVLALLTVLNKRWWIQRIETRWVMSSWVWDEFLRRWSLQVESYDRNNLQRYRLADLVETYLNGAPGWHRVGTEPPPGPVAAPLGAGPLGVGIVRNDA